MHKASQGLGLDIAHCQYCLTLFGRASLWLNSNTGGREVYPTHRGMTPRHFLAEDTFTGKEEEL